MGGLKLTHFVRPSQRCLNDVKRIGAIFNFILTFSVAQIIETSLSRNTLSGSSPLPICSIQPISGLPVFWFDKFWTSRMTNICVRQTQSDSESSPSKGSSHGWYQLSSAEWDIFMSLVISTGALGRQDLGPPCCSVVSPG